MIRLNGQINVADPRTILYTQYIQDQKQVLICFTNENKLFLQYRDNGSAYAEWERINNAIDVNMANLHNYPGANTQVIADAIKELAKNISIPEASGLAGIRNLID